MDRRFLVVVLIFGIAAMAGCSASSAQIPEARVGLSPLSTTASYEIIGDAVGTSSGGRLFFFIPVGTENKTGLIGSGVGTLNPVQSAAVYNAIESVPTADALLAPRFSAVSKNYLIYSEQTVTVKGKAIRYVSR